ncbi:MAG: 5-methyltetrahydropteroyltriglutamate--homocysteine S-methyltransferase [Gammaproteobacteria bacterium]|nr:5-methyltetrahydropteroyltriglutamate--homocysteine S-methyltransferase [Gammaproteobacteria bacterium]
MTARNKPPFRADHVGSFLRPRSLLDLRRSVDAGEAPQEQLRAHEDECIRELVRMEEEIGLQAITDGEFRRETFHGDFISKLRNVQFKQLFKPGTTKAGGHEAPFVAVVSGKVERPAEGIEVDNFRFVQSLTERTAKQTIPSPTMTHFRGGRDAIDHEAYPELGAFFSDLARAYREEVNGLAAAGCRYLQMDDTNLAYLCDDSMREQAIARGENVEELPHAYARLINDSIAGRPDDMAVCVHLCRGNAKSRWFAEGGYEPVAEAIFNEMDVDGFFLEYDDERSGDFAPLRFLPKGKAVVLGLVSTKWNALEDKDAIKRRIDEASRYAPLEQLCLSPQCGFASVSEGNEISADFKKRKLSLVLEVAEEVWG